MDRVDRVLLGVTGSIAAYKSLELIRMLEKSGVGVNVVLTESGARFIPPINFQTFISGNVYSPCYFS